MSHTKRPEMGQSITFNAILEKISDGKTTRRDSVPLPEPRTGIYIGYRHYQQGRIEDYYNTQEGYAGRYVIVETTREGWLIVTSPHQNPVIVDPVSTDFFLDNHPGYAARRERQAQADARYCPL